MIEKLVKLKTKINSAGFTLFELILVMSIMSLVTFTMLPKDTETVDQRVTAASKKLQADIRLVQNLSMSTNIPYGIRSTGANTYEVYNANTNSVTTDYFDPSEPFTENLESGFGNVEIASAFDIVFDTDGQLESGSDTMITISEGSADRQIEVLATTGYVGISDW